MLAAVLEGAGGHFGVGPPGGGGSKVCGIGGLVRSGG